jgi:McrBC 5-methylcytosine restriction system component
MARQHPPPGVVVRPKHSVTLNADFRLKIETDILLIDETTNRPLAVLDTKYTSGDQPSEADIYQVAFYARELQVQRGMLVYPSQTALRFCIHHGKDILLESVIFDLSAPSRKPVRLFMISFFGIAEQTMHRANGSAAPLALAPNRDERLLFGRKPTHHGHDGIAEPKSRSYTCVTMLTYR